MPQQIPPEADASTAAGVALATATIPENSPDIEKALAQIKSKAAGYERWSRYYEGDQRLVFATEKFRNAFGDVFFAIVDNMCELVVESIADRLEVTAFGVETKQEVASTKNAAWEIWQTNRMDERAGLVHREALTCGDGYVLVWPDPEGQPVLWPQKAALMTVYYDDERPTKLLWAAKVWRAHNRVRVNLYYPDRIEKWVTKSAGSDMPSKANQFERYTVEGEIWPLKNPYGEVPCFHFPNNSWIGSFGKSELKPVTPLQDALNKSLCDMLVSAEFAAFAQRWATGIEEDIDPTTGKPVQPFKPGIDRIWAVANEQAKFGQFETADLRQFLEVQESLRAEIALVAGLPPYFMKGGTGANMSGEALKTAESRFVKKVAARQRSFGNAWENAMAFALKILRQGDNARLSTEWAPAAPESEKEKLENLLVKKDLGVTPDQLLSEAGYSQGDIERMSEERERNASAIQRQFNSGFTPGMPEE